MVPLYLPLTLDEPDQSAGTPIFFGGINVYLEQKSAFFRHSPKWLHQFFDSRSLLKWAAGRAAKTRAEDVGDLTLSMFRGEAGNQARELDELIAWLKTQPAPEIICLSNALLIGLVRRLREELRVPVVCMLQGEDSFLDSLPAGQRNAAWQLLAERAAEVDLFIAPSRYFGDLMARRLHLPSARVKVVFNGIHLDGYATVPGSEFRVPSSPTLGYFARMCREKGLDTLVESFVLLKQRDRVKNLRLRVGGGCGPSDEPFVEQLKQRLAAAGVLSDVEFHPNLTRSAKQDFLRSLSVFSVPARYSEAFGLYVIEALASGVPVVQPRASAFPELVGATAGGMLCEPDNPASLADALESLLLNPEQARAQGEAGRQAVRRDFNVERMAHNIVNVFQELCGHVKQPA